ncbi:MAG: response regulator [Defluviitaleaceae bacterium]|nr:response regulator [Defluviitaleaceae bacterium]
MEKNGIITQNEQTASLAGFDSERRFTILIIDDTPMIISALSQMLLPLYGVKAAKTGKDGLEIVLRQNIDLILLDVKMPGQDGFEVLENLRQENKQIPVIFLSGATEEADKERGFALGAADYIEKPFVQADVLQRIENVIGGKKQ